MPEARHRRLAIQLAAQLPESREDAIKTLECLKRIVDGYLYPDPDNGHLWLASVTSLDKP